MSINTLLQRAFVCEICDANLAASPSGHFYEMLPCRCLVCQPCILSSIANNSLLNQQHHHRCQANNNNENGLAAANCCTGFQLAHPLLMSICKSLSSTLSTNNINTNNSNNLTRTKNDCDDDGDLYD